MMSADVKANIKQQKILRTGWLGGGGCLLNGENRLRLTKVIC